MSAPPELADAIAAYAAGGTWTDLEGETLPLAMLRDPLQAAGECSNVSRSFAAFLRGRGFDAYDSGDEANVPGGRANRPDNPLLGTAHDPDAFGYRGRRRESDYLEHSATVVNLGGRRFLVDWTAAQFGYDAFPLVTEPARDLT